VNQNLAFLEAMADKVPDDERVLISSVPGDPDQSAGEMWNVRPWRFGDRAPISTLNNYVCVSSFKRGNAGWRRTADLFGRALAFMIDDVGTKVSAQAADGLEPTCVVETSPANFQHWFLFSEPVTDYELFSRLISAFVQQRLGGVDPGMGGANRIGRLPLGINGKQKYRDALNEPWHCRLISMGGRRYELPEIVSAFGLELAAPRRRGSRATAKEEQVAQRAEEFTTLRDDLQRLGMVLKRHANHAGRIPIICPWFQRHTGAAKTGTYLVEPSEHNNWHGSFVCYHSTTHKDDNHLRELKSWVHETVIKGAANSCQRANENATKHNLQFAQLAAAEWHASDA